MGLGCLRQRKWGCASRSVIACEQPSWLEKAVAAEVWVPGLHCASPLEGPLGAEFPGAVRSIQGGRKRFSALISWVPPVGIQLELRRKVVGGF